MLTFSGLCIAPQNKLAPSLEAVALGLARESRWCGQTTIWFPVLAHSFLVAELAAAECEGEHDAEQVHGVGLVPCPSRRCQSAVLHALLHDAPEMIGRDHPTTWKTDADRAREHEIMGRLYEALGLADAWPLTPDLAEAVGRADLLALRAEGTLLMPPALAADPFGPVEPIDADTRSPLERAALAAARRWAANAQVYDKWLRLGGYWQQQWVMEVRAAMADSSAVEVTA